VVGNGQSQSASVSGNGRYVVFWSTASNLVAGDTNGAADTFIYDRQTGKIERVSVSSSGKQGNSYSSGVAKASPDGRFVVFTSNASNLVSGDTNGMFDIFIRDRTNRTTRRVSVSNSGAQAQDHSFGAAVSADGRFVAFSSLAANLVAGDTNGKQDVFVRDLTGRKTTRVSVRRDGGQGNGESGVASIAANGRDVGFLSTSDNLVSGDTNITNDAFVKDTGSGVIERVSVNVDGSQFYGGSAEMSVSTDARYVAFSASTLGPWPQVFVRDRKARTTTVVSVGPDGAQALGSALRPSISGSGRYVAFTSGAHNILPNTPFYENLFVRDRTTNTTTLASISSTGSPIFGHSAEPAAADTGTAFIAYANNVVPGGTELPVQLYFRSI
jgi:hypothetical protein